MLICVDGTWGTGILDETPKTDIVFGGNRAANYATAMMGSFVGLIHAGSHLQNRKYYQGPDMFGFGPNFVSPRELVKDIMEFWRQGDHHLIMTGYSRGAAIVIAAAALLNGSVPGSEPLDPVKYGDTKDVTIEAMFLFDAVARSPNRDMLQGTDFIPSNVGWCYHAIRDDNAHSRSSFGHCGLIANDGINLQRKPTYYVPRRFYTTHGGMGGVPWGEEGLPNLTKDIEAQVLNRRTRDAYAGGAAYTGGVWTAMKQTAAGPAPTRQRFNQPFAPPSAPALEAARAEVLRRSYIVEDLPDGETKVTVEQEKRGSQQVHDWMWPFLRKHHVLCNKPSDD
jgi:hypothetical protein